MNSSEDSKSFIFPKCWSDDVRMNSLFAPIRSKSVNPNDWNSKIQFWSSLIENWCKFEQTVVVNISTLSSSFSRDGKVPACLEDVVQHLISNQILVPKESKILSNDSWTIWAVTTVVTNPLKWTFNTVKNTIVKQNIDKEAQYVHLPVLKYLAEEFLKNVPDKSRGKLLESEDLTKWGIDNEDTLSFLLNWLQKEKKVAICYDPAMLVKFPKKGSKEISISEVDKKIYSVEKKKKILEKIISQLKSQRDGCVTEAKKHLSDKMKPLAIRALRKKVLIENKIQKMSTALDNIDGILDQIEQAQFDASIIECYQKGMEAFKKIMKDNNLTEENVTKTMDDLRETMESVEDLEALHKPLSQSEEEDLEEELNKLLLENLADVPTDAPQMDTKNPEAIKEPKETKQLEKRLEALSI